MVAGVEIGLLGPLQVRCAGVTVAVPAGKQRALLVALLLQAGRPVPAGQLAELLWAPDPPPTAPVALRNNVLRLRRRLGSAGQQLIQTRSSGYVITLGDCELDVARMEQELAAARSAARAGHWQQVATHAAASLSLWRGEPLSDVDLPALAAEHLPRLEEMRLQAHELRIHADLALARHAEAVTGLPQLITVNPLRERLYALLMLALYRCGRRAEALNTYRAAYDILATEIGADPGPELQALHQQILHDDAALAGPSPGTPAGPAGVPARAAQAAGPPRQLPAAVACFTGRDAELAALTSLLSPARGPHAAVLVTTAIAGPAGVGKTALALQWAHQVAERFPDGQFYVNLRGFDPALPPMPATEAIRLILTAFQIRGQLSAGPEALAGLYRSVLAGKKVLIVADNAASAAQVRPLLPGGGGCLVIVTSRSRLAGLVATDGAVPVSLDVLTGAEARDLLAAILGEVRVAAEPEAAGQLIEACGRLPLALAITAARAATRPRLTLAAVAAELACAAGRLDALQAAGDPLGSVRAALASSCQRLSADAARMLRLLGIHPGPDISLAAAASLAGLPGPRAARQLAELSDASLISQDAAGRYALHDLVRLHAAEQAALVDSDAERESATGRMLDHYLHTGHAGARLLRPCRDPVAVDPPSPGTIPEQLADYQAAMSWFEAEHRVLVAAAGQALAARQDTRAWTIAWTLQDYFYQQGHWDDQLAVSTIALTAAGRIGGLTLRAKSHDYRARAAIWLSRYDDADDHLRHALDLYRQAGNPIGQAEVHLEFSFMLERRREHARAADHGRQALELFAAGGHELGQADALNHIGWHLGQLGDYERALAHCRQALALGRQHDGPMTEAAALDGLGYAHHHLGQYAEARTCYQRAINIARQAGDRQARAGMLGHLGDTLQATGDPEAARTAWREALAILDDLQHPEAEQIRAKL